MCPEGAGLAQSLQHFVTLASLFVRPLGDEIPIEPVLGRLDIGPGHLIGQGQATIGGDRKSTRLNSSHKPTPYAALCLKKPIRCPGLHR